MITKLRYMITFHEDSNKTLPSHNEETDVTQYLEMWGHTVYYSCSTFELLY